MWKKKSKGNRNDEQKEQTLEEIFGEMEGLLRHWKVGRFPWRIPLKNTKKAWRILKAAGEKIDTVEKAMLVLNDQGEADEF